MGNSKALIAGTLLFLLALLLKLVASTLFQPSDWYLVEQFLFFGAYLLIGNKVLIYAVKNVAKGQPFDENFLMTIASLGAFAIGQSPEAVAVMLFYQVGELLQDRAVDRSRRSIHALLEIRPDRANLITESGTENVDAKTIKEGDLLLIRPGEKVPLDGSITQGSSSMDTRALTGESLPKDVQEGDRILSGSINGAGILTMRVEKVFSESTASKIIELVEQASWNKAPTEQFITKFARYYTPAVVFAAIALGVVPPLILHIGSYSEWIYRALVFLVVSCPCALVISIPLTFFSGIGTASKKGILVKGGNYLEALQAVETVVFDKTGTLTTGAFEVDGINPAVSFTKEQLIEYVAHAEHHSSHPIASAIQRCYHENGGVIQENRIKHLKERPGFGVSVMIDESQVLAGNTRLMEEAAIIIPENIPEGTVILIAIDGSFAGSFVIGDSTKPESKSAIKQLHQMGVKTVVMLTGDRRRVAEKIAQDIGIDRVYSELLPQQKVEMLEKLMAEKKPAGSNSKRITKTAFVGDGINDAPALARADVGVAMGGIGSDAAIEAADVVLMNDNPNGLVTAIRIAKRTRMIVWQNIAFALGIKAFVLFLGVLGVATMWEAVFADVGVALLAVLNATRVRSS